MAASTYVEECSSHLDVLLENGLVVYKLDVDDPPDVDGILTNMEGLVRLMVLQPRLNGRWSLFVKAILMKMRSGTMIGVGSDLALPEQMKIAEEQAQVIRNLLRHIKREWYRVAGNPKVAPRWWMASFPRQSALAHADEAADAPAMVADAAPAPSVSSASAPTTPRAIAASAPPPDTQTAPVAAAFAWGFPYFDEMAESDSNESTFDYGTMFVDPADIGPGDDVADMTWLYGFEQNHDGSRVAWRQLVDEDSVPFGFGENATHTSPPPSSIGFLVAHFIDGTQEEIPGMVYEVV